MKPCVAAVVVVCLLPLALTLPIQTEDEPAIQTQQQQETLESVVLDDRIMYDGAPRDKRTIGPLRQIFPNLSQLVDRKIQMITRVLFRVIGRLVLRGGLGGGGGGGGGGDTSSSTGGSPGRRISITLPTYPPGEDEDEEDEDEADEKPTNTETTTVGSEANELSGSESQNHEVRVQYTEDQQPAASEDDQQAAADGEADAEEINDADDGRNKRFLPFNLGGGGSAAGGGGSGNFLFDIIRRTADRAARAAGTVYRVVAGTESLGISYDTSATTQSRTTMQQTGTNANGRRALVAGSGNTEASDEKANTPVGVAEQAAEKDDGYQAGVPGPITRLFVIANRGIANLMQDLILRLAQTSERIVNFKARLITSII